MSLLIITAKEARKKTDKYYEEKVLKDKFCEYISRIIDKACEKGEYECIISSTDVAINTDGGKFYKDILVRYGYEVKEKSSIFCDPTKPTEEIFTIRW